MLATSRFKSQENNMTEFKPDKTAGFLLLKKPSFNSCRVSQQSKTEGEGKKFCVPDNYLCTPPPTPSLYSHTFFFHSTVGIPSLDLSLESARDDMNVAKKLMVSVVTNTTHAIVSSNVESQVPHLQSQPPLSLRVEAQHTMYSTDNTLCSNMRVSLCARVQKCHTSSGHIK